MQGANVVNLILGRFTVANLDALCDNFNRTARTILGLNEDDSPIESQMVTVHMAEACACFLESLATEPTASALALSTDIYGLAYISIAKQGNIIENKLTAICNAVAEETGRSVTLSLEEVKAFSTSFKTFINADNTRSICEGLRMGLENFSLRLCLTMQQATRSGMTSYWMVWEALNLCTDFDWTAIAELIPQDFRRYADAVAVVGYNPYYGFNSDLGVAKHTNYMSLSLVACKVLIKSDPPAYSALSRYRGLPTNPKKSDEIEAIIDACVPGVPDAERQIGINALEMVRNRIEDAIQAAEG